MIIERQPEISEILKNVGPISFDIDGVIVYSALSALNKINKRLKTTYKFKDMVEPFAMQEWWKADPSVKDPMKADFDLWHSPAVMSYAPVIPGAPMTCGLLHKLGIEHYFITSRPTIALPFTKYWFQHEMPWVTQDQILMQEKGLHINSDFKASKINEKKIAFHFEDNLDHANKVINRTNATVVLVRHAWNKAYAHLDPKDRNPRILIPQGETPNLFLSFNALLNHLRLVAQS